MVVLVLLEVRIFIARIRRSQDNNLYINQSIHNIELAKTFDFQLPHTSFHPR